MIARGSLTAIVTPMKDDESVDFDAYKKLINWQIEAGTRWHRFDGNDGRIAHAFH